jgi:hypothetical protein
MLQNSTPKAQPIVFLAIEPTRGVPVEFDYERRRWITSDNRRIVVDPLRLDLLLNLPA